MTRSKVKKVFDIGVDAGMVLVIDPCYLMDEGMGEQFYDRVCDALGDKPYAPVEVQAGAIMFPAGFVVSTGGDGHQPLTVELNKDGRVKSIMIRFPYNED